MNLHGIVRGAITAVNPDIPGIILRSTGWTTLPSGKRTPNYSPEQNVQIQVQALSSRELQQIEFLNIQGILRTLYMYGNVEGIDRPDKEGGDIVQFAQVPGEAVQSWLVVRVNQVWPDWCSVVVALQTDVAGTP